MLKQFFFVFIWFTYRLLGFQLASIVVKCNRCMYGGKRARASVDMWIYNTYNNTQLKYKAIGLSNYITFVFYCYLPCYICATRG